MRLSVGLVVVHHLPGVTGIHVWICCMGRYNFLKVSPIFYEDIAHYEVASWLGALFDDRGWRPDTSHGILNSDYGMCDVRYPPLFGKVVKLFLNKLSTIISD
ncbi:hypothetical protein PoB_002642700 [Plakobranchus ocellatus]|uniref:Uncharacterized protein n=1 Tax=Plakobranchus ocellatus TaxID=259542 RepID=A0AAV3ZZC3_9GAST|nr:hypothetical protein PoB_002642700 [Plakobranchus ocellatus]